LIPSLFLLPFFFGLLGFFPLVQLALICLNF
jgi:hypothetical protein